MITVYNYGSCSNKPIIISCGNYFYIISFQVKSKIISILYTDNL